MAHFRLNDFIDIGTTAFLTSVSWQVALDSDFIHIIDESLEDVINIDEWHSQLPMIDDPDNYYADLDMLWCRIKVHIDEDSSPWFICEPKNQNKQIIRVNELDGSVTIYDSLIDNFN